MAVFYILWYNANTPYGVRDPDDIYKLTTTGLEKLWDEGCDLVILACNTASAAALRSIQEKFLPEGKRCLGVFVPLIEALTERNWGDNSPPREVSVKMLLYLLLQPLFQAELFSANLPFVRLELT